jgi:predicted component of type VI protein secretion system
MADLSPDAIEGAASGTKKSFLANAKARNWEIYLERWNDKHGGGDNGVLDTFLELFAAHYDKMSAKRRQ